ncbi:ATP-binding protein [Novosphingobium sp. KCTC 2891]|uniref:ATP-binding protein n=1 Tax=Novosphingobium sp. KCTC 2891 TaxID=2989730 RepID=UPI002222028E|nr:ATP-binding protein [Novosphingobium sp. KCTC 2891]MCW1382243.1 ATP-binding protein [Novosphingobium sp. KCTC 2891]
MDDTPALLTRIADALDRLAPPAPTPADWLAHPAYVWDGTAARAVPVLEAPALALMQGIDQQKAAVVANVARLSHGAAAHDMLLWGSRGMGKSALLRAATLAAQQALPGSLALVQATPDAGLARLFTLLRGIERRFLVFLDDLGFDSGDADAARKLRSWLEGGVEARPANVRLAVTSNRRAIVERHTSEQDDPINPRDAVDDKLALADRFGLSLGFHACSQDDYLAIIAGYAAHHALDWEASDALEWSKRRGGRSGRVAWQYVNELAGRAGRAI